MSKQKTIYLEQNKTFDLGDNILFTPTYDELRKSRTLAFVNYFDVLKLEAEHIILTFDLWERIDDLLAEQLKLFLMIEYNKSKKDLCEQCKI